MNYTFNIRTVVIAVLFITVIIINFDSINYYKSKINKISRRINEGKILMLKKKDIKNDVVLSNNRDYKMRATAINIIGQDRYTNVINFLNMYRDMGNLTNTIMLGDIINEFMIDYVDSLYLPFDGNRYCYELNTSSWCHIQFLDLFVYPTIVKYEKYQAELDYEKYNYIKKEVTVSFEGSSGTIFNLLLPNNQIGNKTFYLYSYNNEVFVHNNFKN